ncbi:efflux RND transporter periplasmic adaptor subunit [Luteirhabdus pelagi]|uniref:efflux RND transporter periplasmic adaptor subunit n=1 Tax=Luteirhabdus pelagi TaxID=2792783 RepID=UPI001939DEE6|nr:efflux RND transporter periplasmic adaptor subunit [Luteirhabdus pelagi]MCT8339254.1 efflux RND transporter periplasmic adaptor subunit [Thermobacterium salinum]
MKKSILISLSSLALIVSSCGDSKNEQAATGPQKIPFPVVTVPTKTVTAYESYPASIEGIVNSEIRAKVSGYISDVLVDEGQKVRKGQLLFKLETQSLSQDAAAAKANVNAAQVEVDKLKPLVEKNIISAVQLETAKAQLEQARSAYNSISANIGYANIKSPVDGYVGAIPLREGALVSPTSQTPLTTVSDISKVYVYFSLNEKEYLDFIQNTEGESLDAKIKNLPKVELVLANGETYPHEGTIETINSQVNVGTGTVSFRAVFPNPERLLSNGYSGKIKIPTVYEDATVIPEFSTYDQQGKIYTYRVQGDSIAVATPIEVIDRANNLIIVQSGIQEGDKIIVKGVGKLRNNTPIVPQPASFDSITNSLQQAFK